MQSLKHLRHNNDMSTMNSYDAINDQENEDLLSQIQQNSDDEESFNNQQSEHLGPQTISDEQFSGGGISAYTQLLDISDDDLRQSVRSLNIQQRQAYNIVLSWCRNKVKNRNSLKPVHVQPIYLFITGGAGAGKSHLIKTIYHTAEKTFKHGFMNPEKPTVLLMAPTGVAAININGTTIHAALAIPKEASDNDFHRCRTKREHK